MNMRDILRIAFVGAVAYGFYKLGEKHGKRNVIRESPSIEPVDVEPEVPAAKTEEDYIREIINELKSRPDKNKKDKNTIDLLEIKLQQLLKGK